MIICEQGFNVPDHDDNRYSMREPSYYVWTPEHTHDRIPNHGLYLRKNLFTDEFEVYRKFVHTNLLRVGDIEVISHIDENIEKEVIFSSLLFEDAVNFAEDEYEKYHGIKEYGRDIICQHVPPVMDICCDIYNQKLSERA